MVGGIMVQNSTNVNTFKINKLFEYQHFVFVVNTKSYSNSTSHNRFNLKTMPKINTFYRPTSTQNSPQQFGNERYGFVEGKLGEDQLRPRALSARIRFKMADVMERETSNLPWALYTKYCTVRALK